MPLNNYLKTHPSSITISSLNGKLTIEANNVENIDEMIEILELAVKMVTSSDNKNTPTLQTPG